MFREIEYVLKIAQLRNYTAAAEELHITQPALSRTVAALEKRLGLRLFERKSHGVELTFAGECYYKYALEVLKKVRALEAEMARLATGRAKQLCVGLVRHPEQRSLSAILERFRKAHPDVELSMAEQLSKEVEWGVRNETLDVGIMSTPFIKEKLKYTPYEKSPLVLVVPAALVPAGLELRREKGLPFVWAPLERFARVPFVLQDRATRMRYYIDEFFKREKFTPRVGLTTPGSSDALRFTMQGVGASVLTPGYVERIRDTTLVQTFCVGTPPAFVTHGAVTNTAHRLSPAARDFIAFYFAEGKKA